MGEVVATEAGRVRGRQRRGVWRYSAIPYAAAPVGERRLRPPQPHDGWSGTLDSTSLGPVPVQVDGSLATLLGSGALNWSEDCLFLNVFTPSADDARRPVMVWIHGGSFVNGAGSLPFYDASNLSAAHDVVVVTINYRLGALGWSHLAHLDPSFPDSGNLGLLDQIAALQWVRRNVDGFGGDPNNVCVFGESAGAMSVSTLLGTPTAAGLFHTAIAQSGATNMVRTSDQASACTDELITALGGGGLDRLIEAPAADVLAAQEGLAQSAVHLRFAPTVDGVVLDRPPLERIASGDGHAVALLGGTTLEEWKLFTLGAPPLDDLDRLRRRVDRLAPDHPGILDVYRSAHPTDSPAALFDAFCTDLVFRIPMIEMLDAHRRAGNPAFGYRFEFRSTAVGGALGSCHALEIPFVFDNLSRPGIAMFTGDNPPLDLGTRMSAAWAAMARNGAPSTDALAWQEFGPERATMRFGSAGMADGIVNDPDSAVRMAWMGA